MIELGIFAKTFSRSCLADTVQAVRFHGLSCLQFNMVCAGLPSLPGLIDDATCNAITHAMTNAGIVMSAVSGTFNTVHPDLTIRADGIARARQLIGKCNAMGTGIVTLCTGSRDPGDMWKYHPDNETKEAWADLIDTLSQLCAAAEEHKITLAIEPEVHNVISSARKALAIIGDVGSDSLKVVIDPANLFTAEDISHASDIMEEAISLLSSYIVLAHAKDIDATNPDIQLAAGTGCLDYQLYLRLLAEIEYSGALILHGLTESQVPGSVNFLRQLIASHDIGSPYLES